MPFIIDRERILVNCVFCGSTSCVDDGGATLADGTHACRDCTDRMHIVVCPSCGHFTISGQGQTINGRSYCPNCTTSYIHSYSFKPEPFFHLEDDEHTDEFMGVELEIDRNDYDSNACSFLLHKDDEDEELYYQKHDGSLRNGIEIVTHPCTLKYHLNKFPWDRICEIAISQGYKSHNVSTCGLHVHVSRNAFGERKEIRDLNIAKVMLLFLGFWDEIVKFSRRDYSQLVRWAKKTSEKLYADEEEDTLIRKSKYDAYDRYTAVNIRNSNTVEFRVFKGTLKVSTIKATLQFVSNIVNYAKTHTLLQIQSADWHDIIHFREYPELTEYVESLELNKHKNVKKITRPDIRFVTFKTNVPIYKDNKINEASYEVVEVKPAEIERKYNVRDINLRNKYVVVFAPRSRKKIQGFAYVRYVTDHGYVKLVDMNGNSMGRAVSPTRVALFTLPEENARPNDGSVMPYFAYVKKDNHFWNIKKITDLRLNALYLLARGSNITSSYDIGPDDIKRIARGDTLQFKDSVCRKVRFVYSSCISVLREEENPYSTMALRQEDLDSDTFNSFIPCETA